MPTPTRADARPAAAPAASRPASTLARRRTRLQWAMIAPAVLLIAGLIAFPIGYTVHLSVTQPPGPAGAGPDDYLGLETYAAALTDTDRFWPAVLRTAAFTVGALALELVLGIAIALLLRKPFRGSRVVRTVMMVPLVTSPVAVAAIWLLLLDPNLGLVNSTLGQLGIAPRGWLTDPVLSLPTLVLIDVWQWTPLVILIALAGLAGLPTDPEEAALVDGASRWQRIRYVTLPMLKTTIVIAAVLRGVDALKTFDLIYATKGPGGGSSYEAETLNVYAYGLSFDYQEYSLAAAVLVIFFVLVLLSAVGVVRRSFKEGM